jgi:two-component sensor histidine kinase
MHLQHARVRRAAPSKSASAPESVYQQHHDRIGARKAGVNSRGFSPGSDPLWCRSLVPARKTAMKGLVRHAPATLPSIKRMAAAVLRFLRRPRPVRTQLLILTLASALPITAFSGILLWRLHDRERAQFEERLRHTAKDLAADIDRQLESMVVTLRTLATSRALARNDLADFHAQARDAIAGTQFSVVLVTPPGQQLLNTLVDFGAPLPVMSDLETLSKTLTSRRPQVSNLFVDSVSKQLRLDVHVPVLRNGEVPYVLVLAFPPELIRDISLQHNLPTGWVRGVSDGNLKVISRSEQHDRFINTQVPEALAQRRTETSVFAATDLAGASVLRAVAPTKNADWMVAATVSRQIVMSATIQASVALILAGTILIGLVALLATLLSRLLSREIRDLADAAQLLGKGVLIASPDGLVSEVNDVKRSLAAAAVRRRQHESERELLAKELSHRVKNSFAVVQSILNATLRTTSDPVAFAKNFKGRLHSMSTAHDILTSSEWQSADLETLVRNQLAAYLDPDNPRIRIAGPRVQLPPEIAVPIGLVLHELGTNAAKHGALSLPSGTVQLSWVLSEDARTLRLEWREQGGPSVRAPEHRGFGSTLIERGLAAAQVERRFDPSGVVCSITMSLDEPQSGQ